MPNQKAKYDCILIDTSVYENHGLKFDNGILSNLSQFKKSPIDLLIPDVIKSEIHSHLKNKIIQTQNEFMSKIRGVEDYLDIEPTQIKETKKLVHNIDPDQLSRNKIDSFIEKTGAKIIDSNSFVSINMVLEKYFFSQPPFHQSGNKKHEFPDAIALIAADKWATLSKKKILVVSTDNDWEKYCEDNKRLFFINDLSKALDIFNAVNAPHDFVSKIESHLTTMPDSKIIKDILGELRKILEKVFIRPTAESHLDWDLVEKYVYLKSHKTPNQLNIIEISNSSITVGMTLKLTVGIRGRFIFYLGDRFEEYADQYGNQTKEVETEYMQDLLVTIEHAPKKDFENLAVLKVQTLKYYDPILVDFGRLDPVFS